MLRNRKDTEEPKLVGVNRVADPTKLKLGTFFSLENWIPAKRYKIKKKRGPEPLVSCAPEPPAPDVCDDSTERGQQLFTEQVAFDQINASVPPITGRTSWAFVGDGELYSLYGNPNCGGGNMSYQELVPAPAASCVQLHHFIDGVSTVHDYPELVDANVFRNAVNTRLGVSDQPAYAFNDNSIGGAGIAIYFPLENTHVDYLMPVLSGYNGFSVRSFAIRGDSVWLIGVNQTTFTPNREILEYDRSSGVLLNRYTTLTGFNQSQAVLTDLFLYVLVDEISTGLASIKKLNRSDGSVAATIPLDNIGALCLGVVSDDLIYVLGSTALYYLSGGTDITFVGRVAPSFSNFSASSVFNNGIFYYGGDGTAGFTPDVFKLELACPEDGPIIASISTGASVAAGAAINVTWADFLDPAEGDLVVLRPAPLGGLLGFTGAALATLSTGGLAGGTLPFTIPALTAPGSYVFQLTGGAGTTLVATSSPFTVT